MELEAPEGSPLVNNCYWWNIVLTMGVGFFVNGPYSLITTAVSAELGQHPSLQVKGQPPTSQPSSVTMALWQCIAKIQNFSPPSGCLDDQSHITKI